MSSSDKQDWQQQTPAQRLSHRPIYRIQGLAEELRKDLNLLPIFKQGSVWDRLLSLLKGSGGRSDTESGAVRSVFFVHCHHPFGQSQFTGDSNEANASFSYALLGTFQFPDGDDEPLWTFLHNNLQDLEDLFNTAYPEKESKNKYISFKTAVAEHRKSEAHDLLVNTVAEVKYGGLVPAVLRELDKDQKTAYWIKYRPCSNALAQDDNIIGKLEIREIEHFRRHGKRLQQDVKNIEIKGAYEQAALQKLFLRFLNPFMMGQRPEGKLDEKGYPYGNEGDFHAFALPVYDFIDVSSWKPLGSLMGWMAIITDTGFQPKKNPSNLDILIGVRNFAQKVREYQMHELLDRPWGSAQTPREFTLQNFHRCSGWCRDKAETPLFEGLLRKTIENYAIFCSLNADNTLILEEDAGKITHLAVNASSRDSKAPPEILIFEKCFHTVIPEDAKVREDYGIRLAESVRQIYEGARFRLRDRAEGSETTIGGFLHEIRNLGESVAGAWLIDFGPSILEPMRNSVNACWTGSYSDLKTVPWRLAPFPELFDSMARAFGVWGRQEVFEVPGNSTRFADIMKAAVDAAVSCVRLRAFRQKSFAQRSDRDAAQRNLDCLKSVGEILKKQLDNTLQENQGADLRLVTTDILTTGTFKRLLVRLVVEAIVHADLESVRVEIQSNSSQKTCNLLWNNKSRSSVTISAVHSCLRDLPLNGSSAPLDRALRGREVLESHVLNLGGAFDHNLHDEKCSEKRFSAKSLRIEFAPPN